MLCERFLKRLSCLSDVKFVNRPYNTFPALPSDDIQNGSIQQFLHHLVTVPMDKEDYDNEVLKIKFIADANDYKSDMIDKLIKKKPSNIKGSADVRREAT